MGKLFTSVSSLWVLFIPLLSVSKVGIIDSIDDNSEHPFKKDFDALNLLYQLGELKQSGLITDEEFEIKKQLLLNFWQH
ncbi:SHOCT domain-containing protein [Desulfosporosinus sp. SYSU MS00001]|uniref:SHOCT domain-containing protein n=1 Tax=Desulfosporosinus sp. SYSU MS00001 TaxID=3416284 RepID=UPI003CEC3F08